MTEPPAHKKGPGMIAGVKVVNLALMLPGPFCALLLGDMGAEVINIERPGSGDPVRQFPNVYETLSRNKKSLTLNLGTEHGREIFYRLTEKTDVVIEGFRPGVTRRLGVAYDDLCKVNPRIVYVSISGYGQDGPYVDLPGHDLSYQGVAGALDMQLRKGEMEYYPVIPTADFSSALYATIAVLAALLNRGQTGQGQYIDISMMDCVLSLVSPRLCQLLNTGEFSSFSEPGYGIFKTRDDKYITLSIAFEDHFWVNLCKVIGRPDLESLTHNGRITRREEIRKDLESIFLTRSREEWLTGLKSANVAVGPAYFLGEVTQDPQVAHRGLILDVDSAQGKIKQVACPIKFSGKGLVVPSSPPTLGEHTREILEQLVYGVDEIAAFAAEGVI